jgi:hypothetical protein
MTNGAVVVVVLLLVLAGSAELVTLTDADFESKDMSGVWYWPRRRVVRGVCPLSALQVHQVLRPVVWPLQAHGTCLGATR